MTTENDYLVVSIHDFKTNLSKYIRKLRRGEANSVVVRRYQKPLVALVSLNKKRKNGENGEPRPIFFKKMWT